MTHREMLENNPSEELEDAPEVVLEQEPPQQTLREKAIRFNEIAKQVREARKNKESIDKDLIKEGETLHEELISEGVRKKKLSEMREKEQGVPELIAQEKKKIEDMPESESESSETDDDSSGASGESKDGLIRELAGKRIQGIMNESRLPNEEYESTVGVYGGKMNVGEDGEMVWDRRGIVSKIDKAGDAVLRTYDEHVVKEPLKMMWRHPKLFLKEMFAPGTKRYRGNNAEVLENIERLGLSDYYGPHENGIEIKQPDIYKHGLDLQDVYRSDQIESDVLKETDRFQALAEASKYVGQIHKEHGGIGELLVSDIIFLEDKDGKLGKPLLNLPDIVFNKEKITSEVDKKTTDMLDFLCSVFGEEYRRSQNLEDVDKALDAIVENYGDKNIISLVESFVKRGRLTLQGDAELLKLPSTTTKQARGIFSQHNKARLASKKDIDGLMKEKIVDACERFLSKE